MIVLDVPVRLGRDEARRLAAEELAKAKYGGVPPELERIAARLLRLFGRLIDWFLDLVQPGSGGHGRFSPVAVVAIVLLLAAVVVIIWRVGLPRWRHRPESDDVAVDVTISPRGYRERADAAAAAGDYRAAVGDRFRGLVRELEERTVLDPRPARTATEVATGAGTVVPAARDLLDLTAAIFNDAWYGDRIADQENYRTMSSLDEQITALVARADLTGAAAPSSGSGPAGVAR